MEKKMFLAVALSMLILIGWPMVFNKKKPQQPVPAANITKQAESGNTGKALPQKELKPVLARAQAKETIYSIENDALRIEVSSLGGKIKQAAFKAYKDNNGKSIVFFGQDVQRAGALQIAGLENAAFRVISKAPNSISLGYRGGSTDMTISYQLDNTDPYVIRTSINVPDSDKLKFKMLSSASKDQSDYSFSSDPEHRSRSYLIYAQEKAERITIKEKEEAKTMIFESKVGWVGISDRYFLFSAVPSKGGFFSEVVADKKNNDGTYSTEFSLMSDKGLYSYSLYAGPKDVNYLRKLDQTLAESIDYGWLAVISVPMLELMKFFYNIIPNYGVAILLLTLIVRLLMYPLQHKSMKSMKKMQELQPHLKSLQEKYKNDKAKLNQEMMQFMKTHKVNPMSGCLPMLLQLPVFIALYKVLANAVELYRSPFMFWITDLSVKDPFYIFPVLMGVTMFIQQKITPNPSMDPTQAKMMLFLMPIIFTVFMLGLPSGLTLYIFFSTLLGIVQQYMMNKRTSN